jgi:hypothetical protein
VTGLDALRVKPYTRARVPYPGGDLPWQVYHGVRNALVRTCRRFGPTGPMGVVTISPDVDDPYRALMHDLSFWERGDSDPAYFVLDDQLNHERYCYAELYGDDPFHPGWLIAVAETLRGFAGWGLGVKNIPDSYVLIFGDRLLVSGRLAGCRSAAEVVAAARRLLRRGGRRWWQFWR